MICERCGSYAAPSGKCSNLRCYLGRDDRKTEDGLLSGRVLTYHATVAIKRPTLADRLWFAFDHWRGTPLSILWALIRGRATGIATVFGHGVSVIYLHEGYRNRRGK